MTKNCNNCRKEFWAEHKANMCCSQKCAHALKNVRVSKACLICKETFQSKRTQVKARKTCSIPCANKYLSVIHKGVKLWKIRTKILLGANHHNWKGGVTPLHQKIRSSKEYKAWRISVFERDDYTCQDCHIRGGYLEADHIKPFSLFPELRFDINNGKTLCKPCHRKTDTYGVNIRNYVMTA